MKDRSTLLSRIYRLKLLFAGALLLVLALLTSAAGDWLQGVGAPHLLRAVVDGLADVLLVTGAIGIAVDFFASRDRREMELEQNRLVQRELIPDYVDAVLKGFAAQPEDMKRVATPEFLDKLATNALALRLGDAQFAREIYTDLRDQAIRAPERWTDVSVSVRLSTAVERSTAGTPLFDVLVEWEYTTVPSHGVRRFACVSDRDEYEELVSDAPATSTWFMSGRSADAADRAAYELLYFSVDGEELPIRRQQRKGGQTYSVSIGDQVVRDRQSVRIKHLYRTTVTRTGHFLFLDLPQPTKNLSLKLDYTDTPIERLTVMDLVTSAKRPEIVPMPDQVNARVVSVDLPGWLLPRAGITFIWTLGGSQSGAGSSSDSSPSRTAA